MDFIVLGGVLGAVMMVAGTVLRDLVPRRLRVPGDDTPWVAVRDRRRSVRSSITGGRLLTIAGVVVLIATVVLVFLGTADEVAFAAVVGLTVSGLIACIGWLLWYRHQESTGAIQRRQLQLIASRLGTVRSGTGSPEVLRERGDRTAQRPKTGAERGPGSGHRAAGSVAPSPPGRRPTGDGPEATRDRRRVAERNNGQSAPSRSSERYPARRDIQQSDHHPIAPRNDRPASRPPTRDPLRQPSQPGEGPQRFRGDIAERSRGPDSRPVAPSPRIRPDR